MITTQVRLLRSQAAGQRIGLLGGSFNPPHRLHLQISLIALKRLKLDAVWWLVTPGNPLKNNDGLPPLPERLEACRAIADHPRIVATGIEAAFGTRYTVDTLRILTQRLPELDFVWLMGADNLAGFHRWKGWQEIAGMMPFAIIDREGETLRATSNRASHVLARFRRPESDASRLATMAPPAWLFLHGPRSALSSTEIRRKRGLR